MQKNSRGPWYVKKNGESVGIVGADSSVVCVLPSKQTGGESPIMEAYLIAAAPLLFDVCTKLKSMLENNLIVTAEGFKINCADVRKSLLDAILRASGYRKAPEEP
jgi:hypothetical protein